MWNYVNSLLKTQVGTSNDLFFPRNLYVFSNIAANKQRVTSWKCHDLSNVDDRDLLTLEGIPREDGRHCHCRRFKSKLFFSFWKKLHWTTTDWLTDCLLFRSHKIKFTTLNFSTRFVYAKLTPLRYQQLFSFFVVVYTHRLTTFPKLSIWINWSFLSFFLSFFLSPGQNPSAS